MSRKKVWLRYLPLLLTVFLVTGIGVLAVYIKGKFFKETVEQRKVVQQITVITPPPPPPPPPPEEIDQPDIEEEEVVEEEIEEAPPDEGPEEVAGEDLGIDAEATAGADGFGLVAKKGGSGILGGGYSSVIKAEINKAILQDKDLKSLAYLAEITLWVEPDGSFKRYQVAMIEGSSETKRKLEIFLASLGEVGKPKPFEEQSNWFSFRISSVL